MTKAGTINKAADAALVLALVIAIYAGARMPGLWSINYYIPGLFDGIFRRSLVGTILSAFGPLRFDYYFIACLQISVLLGLVGILVTWALRADSRTKAIVALFLVGPAGGYLFHEIGYIDQLLYLGLLGVLAVRGRWFALPLLAALLFVHEMAIFTVIPLYLARCVEEERYRHTIVAGAVVVAVFTVIYLFCQTAPDAAIDALMQKIRAHGDYPLRADYYEVFRQKFDGERAQLYIRATPQMALAVSVLLALLVGLCFLRDERSLRKMFTAACTAGACAAPLVLGFFGWDVSRWVFLSIASSVLVLGRVAVPSRTSWLATCGVLLAFLIFGHLNYFDGRGRRPFLPPDQVQHFFSQELPGILRMPEE